MGMQPVGAVLPKLGQEPAEGQVRHPGGGHVQGTAESIGTLGDGCRTFQHFY